jgi:hypothetical protein
MADPMASVMSDPDYETWRSTIGREFSWIDDQSGRTARAFWSWKDGQGNEPSAPEPQTQSPESTPQPQAPQTPTPQPQSYQPQSNPQPQAPQTSSGNGFGNGQIGSGGGGGSIAGDPNWLSNLFNHNYVSGGGGSTSSGGSGGGGGSMTSGQVVSVKTNETAPRVDYTKLIKSLTDGTAKNTASYNKSADAAMKNLNKMYEKVLGLTTGSRDTQLANAQEQAAQDAAKTQMNLSMTGLGNSTVMPSLLAQQQKYANQNYADIKQKANQDLSNVLLNQIGAQGQLSQEKRQTNFSSNPSQSQILQMILPLITGSASGGTANLSSLLSMFG